ncbi:MAG: branched-chain amino acid ABC transporter permease [Oceanococcaceae bacterium]
MPNRPLSVQYADDFRWLAGRWEKLGLSLLLLALIGLPVLVETHWISTANMALTAVVGAVALMILTGFTGQVSLGHAAFLAVGAYTTAVLGTELGLPFWLLIPLSGLLSAGVGLLIGPFALRLEGLYLAIVTIGLIFLVNHILLSMPSLTGGIVGISVPALPWFGSPGLNVLTESHMLLGVEFNYERKLYVLFVALAWLSVLAARNLARSNTGRAMMAVRDQDVAAAVMGVEPARTKITAFGISSFIAGVAGSMFALQQQYLTVEPPFNLLLSVQYIAMIVLGGIGTVFGAVAGAVAFIGLAPLLEMLGRQIPLVDQLSSSQQSTLLFAVVVIVVLRYEPLGLYGVWLRVKRYFLAWPFRY